MVAEFRVGVGERSPIHEGMIPHGSGGDEFGGRSGSEGGGRAPFVGFAGASFFGEPVVEDFAADEGAVAGVVEELRPGAEGAEFFQVAERGTEAVDAGAGGTEAEEETGAAGIAERCLAVGVGEGGPLAGELIDVGRFGEGMTAERTDPVVEVIDADDEDVGTRGGIGGIRLSEGHQHEQGEAEKGE